MINYKFQRVVLACWLCFGICIICSTIIPEKYIGLEHKGTIKTIVSPDDVIDCVDFYKQPAFDDPRIRKDFKLKVNLISDETEMTNDELSNLGLYQDWLKYGECPNGTIPIRRTLNRQTYIKKGLPNRGSSAKYTHPSHEYAIVERDNGAYFGARARLNVWKPDVENDDFSLTQIWVLADNIISVEVIEAGWINDSYDSGCWDLECSGFVQINKKVNIGGMINGVSDQSGKGFYIELAIHKEERDGDWWLQAFGQKVGYWPNSLFKNLKIVGESVQWGGEVYSTQPPGHHSATEMGSGQFPYLSALKASYVSNIAVQIIVDDDKLIWENATNLERHVTRPECYDATIRDPSGQLGTHFYYGGPGASDTCK